MTSKRKLFRYAASLIFATREGYGYAAANRTSLINLKHGSQKQRIAQLSPHVIQQKQSGISHVKGIDVLFVQRSTESGFMVRVYSSVCILGYSVVFSLVPYFCNVYVVIQIMPYQS